MNEWNGKRWPFKLTPQKRKKNEEKRKKKENDSIFFDSVRVDRPFINDSLAINFFFSSPTTYAVTWATKTKDNRWVGDRLSFVSTIITETAGVDTSRQERPEAFSTQRKKRKRKQKRNASGRRMRTADRLEAAANHDRDSVWPIKRWNVALVNPRATLANPIRHRGGSPTKKKKLTDFFYFY